MQRERVTDDIYVFTSDLYAQVTAGVVITSQGAVLIDTLVYPEETKAIKRFVMERLGVEIKVVINTHYHADHTTGTCFFDGAQVIAHERCRTLLDQRGRESLERARAATNTNSKDMLDVTLVLPTLIFDKSLTFYLGDKTFKLWSTPGHSPDSIVCLVEGEQVLFAADTVMPIPYFVDGAYDDFLLSLEGLQSGSFETIIQGHGEVILRGEVEEKIQSDIDYLRKLRQLVDKALLSQTSDIALNEIDIEDCGKSRIPINGMVQQLHRQNVQTLAEQRRQRAQMQFQNGQ
ncbi:MAG: MBL fold metallo-hydrolase [Chitinophagaceae bacterium]|nr:MBL fold metallo-hydrolase [Anaerolineae bacterium]